jgi:hypothetical protein
MRKPKFTDEGLYVIGNPLNVRIIQCALLQINNLINVGQLSKKSQKPCFDIPTSSIPHSLLEGDCISAGYI